MERRSTGAETYSGHWPVCNDESQVPPEDKGEGSGTASTAAFSGGQVGAELAGREAAATDAFARQMALFAERAKEKTDDGLLKGKLFEFIESAKFDRNAARAGKTVRAHVTAAEGQTKSKVDIEIREGSRSTRRVQAKAWDEPENLAKQATNEDYKGMDVLVPKDKAEATNRNLAQKGKPREVVGELRSGGVGSGGTGSLELKLATGNRKLYRIAVEAEQVGREAVVTGANAAVGATLVAAALSTISNVRAYSTGEKDRRTAIRNVAADSAKSGLRGFTSGAFSAVIRQTGRRTGMQALAKPNVASAIAAAVIEVGVTVYDFGKGEITAEEAAGRIGETGASAASGIYVGAAAGAIFGPAGAVVGSIVGYMAMSWVYQSSLAILRQARLTEEEASRVIALCAEATRAMDQQRKVFEGQLETWLTKREEAFQVCLKSIDDALLEDDADGTVKALARLAGMTGKALKFGGFEEFEQFMTRSTDPLVI